MPENSTIDVDQPDRHAVGFHQIADQDEKRDRQQHEIVDAARHLLREDHAGQGALDPDEGQRRQCQRKADRQSAEQRDEEAREHQASRRRHRIGGEVIPGEIETHDQRGHDHARDHVAEGTPGKQIERKYRHQQGADAHRVKRPFQRQPGAGGLSGGQPSQLDGIERHIA
jgi:hypothetical protein